MRAVLTNFGSTGDVQPLFALAVELSRHGHQPVLALARIFANRAARLGTAFVPIGPDVSHEEIRSVTLGMMRRRLPASQIRYMFEQIAPTLPRMFDELREACHGADVLISGVTQPAGRMVHEATGIPLVSVHLQHFTVPSAHRSPAGLPTIPGIHPLRRAINRLWWRALRWGIQRATAPVLNPVRVQLGLPPLDEPLFSPHSAGELTLFAISRHVVRPPADWPARYHLPGYFFLDHDEGWEPDSALSRFLGEGKPPVVVSLGSMIHDDPNAVTAIFLEAARRVGCSIVIQRGWSGLVQGKPPSYAHVVDYVPHRWLFPRAACVVHHGGAGTTAAVLRAGVPSVVVPHFADQPMWARLTSDLGCSPPAIPFSQLSVGRLAAAIAAATNDPGYRGAARALSAKIRAESGVETARALIERHLEARS